MVDSSRVPIHAQLRAEIESSRARDPYISRTSSILLRQYCVPLRYTRSGRIPWPLTVPDSSLYPTSRAEETPPIAIRLLIVPKPHPQRRDGVRFHVPRNNSRCNQPWLPLAPMATFCGVLLTTTANHCYLTRIWKCLVWFFSNCSLPSNPSSVAHLLAFRITPLSA